MRSYLCILILFLTTISVSNGQDKNHDAANKYLKRLFKNESYRSYCGINFIGYRKSFSLLEVPVINKLLPDYTFYFIWLNTDVGYFEYPSVETILAFSQSKPSLINHSPLFTATSVDFIHLFYGLQVNDTTQAVTVASEIMTMMSAITYNGRFNRVKNLKDNTAISFELWQDEYSLRMYDFYFDDNKQLTKIEIQKGGGRYLTGKGYQR